MIYTFKINKKSGRRREVKQTETITKEGMQKIAEGAQVSDFHYD